MTYMRYDYIYDTAMRIIQKYNTRDPYVLASSRGIHIYIRNDFSSLKGMYAVVKRRRCIFINGNIPEAEQKMVCGHELGHDVLHIEFARHHTMKETSLFVKDTTEYEANLFLAHLLLDEEEIMDLAAAAYGIEQAAAEMNTYVDLLLMKLEHMRRHGYQVNIPDLPSSDFWGR